MCCLAHNREVSSHIHSTSVLSLSTLGEPTDLQASRCLFISNDVISSGVYCGIGFDNGAIMFPYKIVLDWVIYTSDIAVKEDGFTRVLALHVHATQGLSCEFSEL